MASRVWRWLLDQNFPAPVVDVQAVDNTVEYEALTKFDASLAKALTPDWLIYLTAARSGRFDGVVTRDRSQLDQPEELVAVIDTGLNVVTWQHPVEDPIQEWGQLLAYMPLVARRLEGRPQDIPGGKPPPHVFFLPRPRLGADNVSTARQLLGQFAADERRAYPDIRDEARHHMRQELRRRKMAHLEKVLGP